MMYKLEEDPCGDYIKSDTPEKRYRINECVNAYTPLGKNAGYTFYYKRSDFLTAMGLVYSPFTESQTNQSPS